MQLVSLKVNGVDVIRDGERQPLPAPLARRLAPLDDFLRATAKTVARPAEPSPLHRWGAKLRHIFFTGDQSRCGAIISLRPAPEAVAGEGDGGAERHRPQRGGGR